MQKQSNNLANVLSPVLLGGAGGAGAGALAGAAYNGLFGKPQLFYDDLGRGALRGLLAGGGAGVGFGAGGSDPNAQRFGGRVGLIGGSLAGNLLVRRNEDDDEYLARLQTGEKKKKKPKKYMRSTAEKQSKVYEAAESVDMPVKHTKMNHKKCTPGEFGAMVKEAVNPKAMVNLVRQAVGNVGGALTQGAPQAARKAMLGQRDSIGFVRDLGSATGRAMPPNYVRNTLQRVGRDAFREQLRNNAIAAGLTAGAGVGAGYGAKYQDVYRDEANRLQQNTPQTAQPAYRGVRSLVAPNSAQPAATQTAPMIKTQSARDFGAMVKQSFNIQKYLPAAGMGAGVGAGVGALSGLINPGEEDEYDDRGRVVGRRQRSRLGAMMRNALMGAGVGGVVGGAANYFAPNATNIALQKMRGMFQRPQQPAQQPANGIAPDDVIIKNMRDAKLDPTQSEGVIDQHIMRENPDIQYGFPVDTSGIEYNPDYPDYTLFDYFKDNPFATPGTLNVPSASASPLIQKYRPPQPGDTAPRLRMPPR